MSFPKAAWQSDISITGSVVTVGSWVQMRARICETWSCTCGFGQGSESVRSVHVFGSCSRCLCVCSCFYLCLHVCVVTNYLKHAQACSHVHYSRTNGNAHLPNGRANWHFSFFVVHLFLEWQLIFWLYFLKSESTKKHRFCYFINKMCGCVSMSKIPALPTLKMCVSLSHSVVSWQVFCNRRRDGIFGQG